MGYYTIRKEEWEKSLEQLILSHTIFATVDNGSGQDYELLKPEAIPLVQYNKPKPVTPLKSFFLPVKENVTSSVDPVKPRIIIGIPNCDIEGLELIDEIYLDSDYTDLSYKNRRNSTILISTDCFTILEHCHCLSYSIRPYSTKTADLSIVQINGSMVFRTINGKGEAFVKGITGIEPLDNESIIRNIDTKHKEAETLLTNSNKGLPDFPETGRLTDSSVQGIWKKYSSDCVSCGACTTICPTCTCFLLIDKPGFEKIKQMDGCQYPGFERVAGGEDALHDLSHRFRNRYMCKYFWKSKKFKSQACTGCGRCIEACIGKISKNELFRELVK